MIQMGRNDMCFCGSGKKQKKCHSDIVADSVFANVIDLYNRMDQAIADGAQRDKIPCSKGCNECCRQHFTISTAEFYYIVDRIIETKGIDVLNGYMLRGIGQWVEYKVKQPDMAKRYMKNLDGYANEEKLNTILVDALNAPELFEEECIFVGEDGGCDIYEYRPSICRAHGCTNLFNEDEMHMLSKLRQEGQQYDIRFCSKSSYMEIKDYIANIDEIKKEMLDLSNHFSSKHNMGMTEREYPIMYFMKIIYENRETLMNKINEYKRLTKEECINRRADRVLARNR